MNEYRFGVTGKDRKALVAAISEVLKTPSQYLKTPTYAYQVGNLNIDRDGAVTGEVTSDLLTALAERGYIPERTEEVPEDSTEPEAVSDRVCIEVPLDGFTPESLDNLSKMVAAKEPLIKKALGADKLPIRVLKDRVAFDWFNDTDNINEYAKFIAQLCKTAKEKKRVTAKSQEAFENEKFTMRVWLIGLGLIGKDYSQIRKLLTENLSGNAAWRHGQPTKAADESSIAV
jgi:hypothetical protein